MRSFRTAGSKTDLPVGRFFAPQQAQNNCREKLILIVSSHTLQTDLLTAKACQYSDGSYPTEAIALNHRPLANWQTRPSDAVLLLIVRLILQSVASTRKGLTLLGFCISYFPLVETVTAIRLPY
jgi:hypothetical protein